MSDNMVRIRISPEIIADILKNGLPGKAFTFGFETIPVPKDMEIVVSEWNAKNNLIELILSSREFPEIKDGIIPDWLMIVKEIN